MPTVITANIVENEVSAGSSLTTAVNVGSGTDRGLIVGIVSSNALIYPIPTVTYAGIAMSQKTHLVATNSRACTLFWLSNPASGSNNFVLDWASTGVNADVYIIAIPMTDCHQTTASMLGTEATATNAGNGPATVNVSSAAGELVVDVLAANANAGGPNIVAGAGQTEAQKNTSIVGGIQMGGMSYEAGAGTVTMSWTLTNGDNWAIMAVGVKPPPGAAVIAARTTITSQAVRRSATW